MLELFKSIEQKHIKYTKQLLEEGYDVNFQLEDGITPLMTAADYSNLDMIILLIENGADLSIQDNSGQTPLMKAQTLGDLEIINLLSSIKRSVG
jgi:ankyrin repeat protein